MKNVQEGAWETGASETLFHSLADTTSAAIFIVREKTIRYANPAATFLTAYPTEELVGMAFTQLVHPDYRPLIEKNGIGNHWTDEAPSRYEIKIVRKGGEDRWIDLSAGRLQGDSQVDGLVITAFDITARELAERELRQSKLALEDRVQERIAALHRAKQRLEAVLGALPLAVWIADASGAIIEKNAMVNQVWGETAAEMDSIQQYEAYRGWWAGSGKPLAAEEWALARAIQNQETSIGEVIDIQRFDGARGTILSSAAPILDEAGRLIGAVAVAQDITHQRQLERQAREVAEQAQRQAEKLNVVIEKLADSVLIYNHAGEIVQANPAVAELFGFDPTGKRVAVLYETFEVHRPDGTVVPKEQWPSSRALRGETVPPQRMWLKNRLGREFRTIISAAPLYIDGSFFGAVSTIHDITEQERLLAESTVRAEELDAVIHSMAEAVLIFDASGKPVLINPVAADVFGLDAETLDREAFARQLQLYRPDGERVAPQDLPVQRALAGTQVIGERYTYRRKNGLTMDFMAYVSPLRAGERITGAVSVWHDVTEQEQLFSQLEAERARLSAVIANAPEAILVGDETGSIILANPVAERLYGHPIPYGQPYTARSLQKIYYPDGRPYDPRDLPLTRSALDGEVVTNVEATVHLPDGSQRDILINSGPIYDRNGKIAGAIAISQDIGPRKQIEAQIRKNAARAEVLSSLSQAFAEAGLYYAAVLSTITHQITEKIGDASIIRMISDDNKWLDVVAVQHPEHEALVQLRRVLRKRRLQVDEGISGQALNTRRPLLIQNPSAYPDQALLQQEYSDWLTETEARSLLIIPLQAQGSLIGTLSVIRPRSGEPYDADDQIFFMNLADRAAMSIENAILFADEARRARELDALHSATSALLSTLDLNVLLSEILDAAQSAISSAERGILHLVEPETGNLEIRATLNYKDPRIARITHPNGTDYPSVVVRNRKPLLIHDALTNSEAAQNLQVNQTGNFRSLIIAPLYYGENVIGTLSLTAARPFAFTKEDLRLLVSFATTTSAAIQNAMLHAKVQTMAITDPLTEQYNRRGFFDLAQREMERYSRYHYPLAAIMLDIDRFKEVNDTYGHRTGDRVLRALAERINENIRQVDILGRYGGEEFAILLPETELFKACEIAERIRAAVANSPIIETEHGPVSVSISIGVTRATKATTTLTELLEYADKALYMAKENGRNRVEIL
ncbi:MAG TPA: diguanylate cyclase [Anaerolineaceae bacterium]|nr:diguanylate cyclase [Anaerolineaceae bacterium]